MPIIIGALIGGGLGLAGSALTASATGNAQDSANATNAAIANNANQLEWNRYLISRGINPGNVPGINGSSVNTLLPLNFVDSSGQPLESGLLQQILGIAGQTGPAHTYQNATIDDVRRYLQANPDILAAIQAQPGWENENRSPEQWFLANLATGDTNPDFTTKFNDFLASEVAARNTATGSTVDTATLNGLLNIAPGVLTNGGGFLTQEQGAANQVAAARDALAAIAAQRNTEMRQKSGDILNTDLTGVQNVLDTRTGSIKNIYDQELLGADTYENAVKQATAAQLNQQLAARARQGYVGAGSGDAITRARILASGYQQAGGARAQAGINQATRLGSAQDEAAQARLQYNDENARRLAGILDADAASQVAQANLARQTDNASLISNDIARQIANLNQPVATYNSTVQSQAAAPYANINALLQALGFFKQGQPATPGVITPQVQPTINGGQIAGSAISGIGSGITDYYTTQAWLNALRPQSNYGTATTYVGAGGDPGGGGLTNSLAGL
jgi:hypothetical protein